MPNVLTELRRAALDLLAPPACLACGKEWIERDGLGERCLARVAPPPPCPCPRCAAPLGPGIEPHTCPVCAELRPRFAAAVAAGPYAGFLGEILRRAKYGHDPLLIRPLAALLREHVRVWYPAHDAEVVIPVPSVPSRERERGFNPATMLALVLARELGAKLETGVLERVGDPVPQASLARSVRRDAARGTVAPRRPLLRRSRPSPVAGRVVLLVDDVLTTGATANASARALLGGGAQRVLVAVATRA